MFGTNWPTIAPVKALEGLDELRLEGEVRDLFLSRNALRVFRLNDE